MQTMTGHQAKQLLDRMQEKGVGAIWAGRWIWPDDLRRIMRGEVGAPDLFWSPSLKDFTVAPEIQRAG